MFTYTGKYWNLAIIVVGVAVLYSYDKQNPGAFQAWKNNSNADNQTVLSAHTLKLDVNKPDENRTVIERLIFAIYKNDINKAVQSADKGRANKIGDKFHVRTSIYYSENQPPNVSDQILVIGSPDIPRAIIDRFWDARVGDTIDFKDADNNAQRIIYEIKQIDKAGFKGIN